MTTEISHEAISDFSGCPDCVAKGEAGYATAYFNAGGKLWAVCNVHRVRWYVTPELTLGGIEEDAAALQQYPEVEGVHRMSSQAP
jgi:hypothetical protein